jgi:CheY-like chemotaxis protein
VLHLGYVPAHRTPPSKTARNDSPMPTKFKQQTAESRIPTVLVAEDNFDTRWLTAEFLRMSGYRVIEAMNSVEAIDVLCSGTAVDLVFSDVYMPGSPDGFALVQWVTNQCPHLSVLITSAAPAEATRAAGLALDFLEKPYDLEVLLRRIESMLHKQFLSP